MTMLRSGASCSDGRTQPQRSRVDRLHAECQASASRTAVGTGAVAAGIPSADLVRHRLPGPGTIKGYPFEVVLRTVCRFPVPSSPIRSRASIGTPGASSSSERYRTVLSRMCRLVLLHCLVWTDRPGPELPDAVAVLNSRDASGGRHSKTRTPAAVWTRHCASLIRNCPGAPSWAAATPAGLSPPTRSRSNAAAAARTVSMFRQPGSSSAAN